VSQRDRRPLLIPQAKIFGEYFVQGRPRIHLRLCDGLGQEQAGEGLGHAADLVDRVHIGQFARVQVLLRKTSSMKFKVRLLSNLDSEDEEVRPSVFVCSNGDRGIISAVDQGSNLGLQGFGQRDNGLALKVNLEWLLGEINYQLLGEKCKGEGRLCLIVPWRRAKGTAVSSRALCERAPIQARDKCMRDTFSI